MFTSPMTLTDSYFSRLQSGNLQSHTAILQSKHLKLLVEEQNDSSCVALARLCSNKIPVDEIYSI